MADESEGNQQNPPPDVVLRTSTAPSTSQGVTERLGGLSIAQRVMFVFLREKEENVFRIRLRGGPTRSRRVQKRRAVALLFQVR